MARLSTKQKNDQIIVKRKLVWGEKISEREVQVFKSTLIRGLVRPNVEGKKITYTVPGNQTLQKYLQSGIGKKEFFVIIAQIIELTKKIDRYGLNINNLILNIQYVYMNNLTKEMHFIYQPVVNKDISTSIYAFVNDIAYAAVFQLNEDTQFINDFMKFLQNMERYSATEIEQYILKKYPETYKQVKREQPKSTVLHSKACFDKIESLTKNAKEFNIHNNLEWNSYANHGIESKENVTKYNGYTVYTGYMYGDCYPNVYKVSSSGSRRMLQHDAHIVKRQGKYLYTEDNHGDFCESCLWVINSSTNKIKLLTSKSDGTVKTTSSYAYYPVFSKYEYQDYKFKIYRCKLNGTNKKALTKTISAKDIIKYTSTYVKYKKGSYQYIYYYKSGKIKKVSPVNPSVKISGGSTGSSSCTLTATTVPANSTVSWSSSDTNVATVSNGKVTAKGTGTATITAKITYNGKVYSAKKTVKVSSNKTYGPWSSWSTTAVSATSTREVKTTTLYRYYCYYCPICGGCEPFKGTSDCHKYTLSDSNWKEKWSTIPYSQCSPKSYSYTTIKRYTESLGDGKRWNFSTGNLNHTAIGTIDYGGSAVVIKKGYSYRSVSTNYYISSI